MRGGQTHGENTINLNLHVLKSRALEYMKMQSDRMKEKIEKIIAT